MSTPKKELGASGSGKVTKSSYLTFDVLSQYFHLPISAVGKELGVCATMLKKICRKNGIPRWPYRQIKSLNRMIASLEAQPEDDEHVQSILKTLRYKRENLLGNPHMAESLLRHRKQFRMITKRNNSPAARPKARQANEMDDLAVAALSTLASSSSPEHPCQAPYKSFYIGTNPLTSTPGSFAARNPSMGHYAQGHYAQEVAKDPYAPARYAPLAPAHSGKAEALAQAHAQAHAMLALNHHQMHLQQPQQQAQQQQQQQQPASQMYRPQYRLHELQHVQQQLQQQQASAYSSPSSSRGYAPSWHAPASPPKMQTTFQMAPQAHQMAQACSSALKLPELHLEAPAQKSLSSGGAKLPPLEPNAMSLKHLLAF